MHKTLVKIACVVQEICLRTDRHTHTQTCSLQYFASAPAGEVTSFLPDVWVRCCPVKNYCLTHRHAHWTSCSVCVFLHWNAMFCCLCCCCCKQVSRSLQAAWNSSQRQSVVSYTVYSLYGRTDVQSNGIQHCLLCLLKSGYSDFFLFLVLK